MTTPDVAGEAARSVRQASAEFEQPTEVELHEDRTREFRTPGFHRMATYAANHHDPEVDAMIGLAENIITTEFADAFWLINEIWDLVREPVTDRVTGEIMKDRFGWPIWKRRPDGSYIEDWSKLGSQERTRFIHLITTHLFEWHQRAADMWGRAMFHKGKWEEAYSFGFQALPNDRPRPTEADRTAHARVRAVDERYFGIWCALLSRKGEAVVSSMELLNQRLKDTTSLS